MKTLCGGISYMTSVPRILYSDLPNFSLTNPLKVRGGEHRFISLALVE